MADTPNEYAEKLAAMTDEALVGAVDRQVWLSAFASNNPRAPAHWKTDLTHAEAKRRGKPWLYQRGWNTAYASCGHTLSQADIENALDPSPGAATTQPLASGDAQVASEVRQPIREGLKLGISPTPETAGGAET